MLDGKTVIEIKPQEATEDEILLVHSKDYLEVVKILGDGGIVPAMHEYGIGHGDNPPRRGMYRWSALCAGATLEACRAVCSNHFEKAFAPAGGVHHHAMHSRASGFGIFNDVAVAIADMARQGMKVAYIDIDCHHGDGVQQAFYNSDQILTISIHESGTTLFPGSGFVEEMGTGVGRGFNVNIPLEAFTESKTWLWALEEIVPPLLSAFKPDIVLTQLGIDSHYLDRLTHLLIDTQSFAKAVTLLGEAISENTNKWVAVGGGGYNLGAVARGWTMALAGMAGKSLPERIPDGYTSLPDISTFHDQDTPRYDNGRQRKSAKKTMLEIKRTIFPLLCAS